MTEVNTAASASAAPASMPVAMTTAAVSAGSPPTSRDLHGVDALGRDPDEEPDTEKIEPHRPR